MLTATPVLADDPPQFTPEPFWPKDLPENWILGQVSGIAVAPDDTIWLIHRPGTLVDDEKGAMQNPPATKCCKPAPPVLQFDADEFGRASHEECVPIPCISPKERIS